MSKEEKMPLELNTLAEAFEVKVKALKAPMLSLNNLVGTWNNCDKQTRGLIKVVLRARGNMLNVQCFGSCTPTPCNWGVVRGTAYAENVSATTAIAFSAMYNFKFKTTIVTGYLDCGCLVVESYNTFKDGSGRSNYYSRYYMCKE